MKCLSPDHDPAAQVRKITRKRIEKALRVLRKKRIADEHVHSARKALKKARATLRLLRPGLRGAQYRRVNAALRDAGRPLSAVRDAQVLSDTLGSVVSQYEAAAGALPVAGLKQLTRRQHAQARNALVSDPALLAHSRRLLRRSRTQLHAWKLREKDWKLLGAGLRKVYAQARTALARAREQPTDARLHEWRKQAKYLRYELEVLIPLWPAMIGRLVQQMHALADLLGDNHDLTLMREMVIGNGHSLEDPVTLDVLLGLIVQRQGKLQGQAMLLGERLFQEKPRVFRARFEQYWRQWRRHPAGLASD